MVPFHRWGFWLQWCPVRRLTVGPLILFVLATVLLTNLSTACHPSYHYTSRPIPDRNQPFVYKERYPNLAETHPLAAGPPTGRIRRTDVRFRRLVNNTNADIVFKDEEGTGADHIMTNRCRFKLNLLSMLVQNFWPDLKLRVVDAWEERNRQAIGSLHYEGRAVDLTTSDRDPRKIPRLARLAVQAGFDWVFYESKHHVHASVKPDSTFRHPKELQCFPADAQIRLADGGQKQLDNLKPGDMVLSQESTGKLVPTEVVTFLHVSPNQTLAYIDIVLHNGLRLTISPEHLVYKSDKGTKKATFAKHIQTNDELLHLTSNGSADLLLTKGRVVSVEMRQARGAYAPLTSAGSMFINDIYVSSYAAVSREWIAHAAMAPLRLAGQLSSMLGTRIAMPDNGVHWYARSLMSMARTIDRVGAPSPIDYHE